MTILLRGMIMVAFLTGAAASARADADPMPAPPDIVSKCENCHGARGDSSSLSVPRLNGQQSIYIETRLKQFLDPTIGTPHATHMMWETASSVSDRIVVSLAAYFSGQVPTQPKPGNPLAVSGGKIYRDGAGAENPPCQGCHGANAEGRGTIPRLAGQHAEYLAGQIRSFMVTARIGSSMNRHALHLSEDQIKAVTAFLASE